MIYELRQSDDNHTSHQRAKSIAHQYNAFIYFFGYLFLWVFISLGIYFFGYLFLWAVA